MLRFLVALSALFESSLAFNPGSLTSGFQHARSSLFVQSSSASSVSSASASKEVFVLSFDGCVASTTSSRITIAVDAALLTWPHLNELILDDDRSWLINKMTALSSVTQCRADYGLGIELVLLARLLMEEQRLDEGRSVGKSGKYASRFHPSTGSGSGASSFFVPGAGRSVRKSRPLTVGEISANWSDGGYLVDSLPIRYRIDQKSPLKTITDSILKAQQNMKAPPIPLAISDSLSSCKRDIIVILGHRCQLSSARASLSQLGKPLIIRQNETADSDFNSKTQDGNGSVTIVLPNNDSETQTQILERLLVNAGEGSSFFVVHGNLSVLKKSKYLLGDDSPVLANGFGTSVVGPNVKLSFFLPSWADNTDSQQHRDAEMDPWLNIIHDTDFSEQLTANFVTVE